MEKRLDKKDIINRKTGSFNMVKPIVFGNYDIIAQNFNNYLSKIFIIRPIMSDTFHKKLIMNTTADITWFSVPKSRKIWKELGHE